jgi:AcrR family transcriptional regulator
VFYDAKTDAPLRDREQDNPMPDAPLRETLVATALRLLQEGEEPGLRAVARAAGVSAMAPYRHFADKAALMTAVAEAGFDRLRARLEAADALPTGELNTDEGREALLRQGLAYIAFAREEPLLFRLMFGQASGCASAAAAQSVLARRAATLVAPEAVPAAVLACWSIVHGLAALRRDGLLPGLSVAEERAALSLFTATLGRPAPLDPAPAAPEPAPPPGPEDHR